MTQIVPLITLADNVPAVTSVTSPVQICRTWHGRMQVLSSGLDGKPFITLESSLDNINWCAHNELTKIKITEDLVCIRIGMMDALYYRIRIDDNGNTTGSITAEVLLKHT